MHTGGLRAGVRVGTVGWVTAAWLLGLALVGCGPRAAAPDDEPMPEAPLEDLGDPADTPEEVATVRPPGRAPRLREPLPDGWPREPVEPLPLKGRTRTVVDAADPVARFVVDFPTPGRFELALQAEKATAFKARVVLYDSLGATLAEGTLAEAWAPEPRDVLPGTLYLLVERRGGAAEVVVKAQFDGEGAPDE